MRCLSFRGLPCDMFLSCLQGILSSTGLRVSKFNRQLDVQGLYLYSLILTFALCINRAETSSITRGVDTAANMVKIMVVLILHTSVTYIGMSSINYRITQGSFALPRIYIKGEPILLCSLDQAQVQKFRTANDVSNFSLCSFLLPAT